MAIVPVFCISAFIGGSYERLAFVLNVPYIENIITSIIITIISYHISGSSCSLGIVVVLFAPVLFTNFCYFPPLGWSVVLIEAVPDHNFLLILQPNNEKTGGKYHKKVSIPKQLINFLLILVN